MSWNFREVDQRQQIAELKEQLSNQESTRAALEDQLLRKNAELLEFKQSLDKVVPKLRSEADRGLRLEADLAHRTEDLRSEQLARQNAETALHAAHQRAKAEADAAKELQTIVERLSHDVDGTRAQRSTLVGEKTKLEARVRELEMQARRMEFASPTPARPATRPRTSSLTNLRVVSLEREVEQLRESAKAGACDLRATKEKLACVQSDLMRVENEKMALERRIQGRGRELQDASEEQQEELAFLRMQSNSAAEREQELLARLDEEERKVELLEKQLARASNVDDLKRTLERTSVALSSEVSRRTEAESREVQLVKEREDALDELDTVKVDYQTLSEALKRNETRIAELEAQERELRERVASSSLSSQAQSQTDHLQPPQSKVDRENGIDEASIARLLDAIERLRAERNALRRDLEFIQAESRFAIDALQAKLENAPRIDKAESKVQNLRLATAALLVSVRHLQDDKDTLRRYLDIADAAKAEQASIIASLREELISSTADADNVLVAIRKELKDTESQIEDKAARLEDIQATADNHEATIAQLQAQLQVQSEELCQMKREKTEGATKRDEELAALEDRLSVTLRALEDADQQRGLLTPQIANLQSELSTVQQDLAEAEQRCSRLQSTQLTSMTSSDAVRTLKEQVETLEARVLRRTEQIGIHQHDIKRLETNMRLAEDRLGELTSELEMANTEKDAMLEDCSTARDERDGAQKMVESLEEDVDTLTQQLDGKSAEIGHLQARFDELQAFADNTERSRTTELAALASVVAERTCRSRGLVKLLRSTRLTASMERRRAALLTADINAVQKVRTQLTLELEHQAGGSSVVAEDLERKTAELEAVKIELAAARLAVQKLTAALEATQAQLESKSLSLTSSEAQKSELDVRVINLEDDLHSKIAEVAALQDKLSTLHSQHAQEVAQLGERHTVIKRELDSRLRQTSAAVENSEAKYQRASEMLVRSTEDLTQQRSLYDNLQEKIDQARSAHAREKDELEGEVKQLQQGLQMEKDGRKFDHDSYDDKLKSVLEQYESSSKLVSQLRVEMDACQERLNAAHATVEAVEMEKAALQANAENLAAEQHRTSLENRWLEKQIDSSVKQVGSLTNELALLREKLASSETSGKAAEMNLDLIKAHHEKTIASLRKQLKERDESQSQSSELQRMVDKLREDNEEQDRLLKNKCIEIEEHDEKLIQILKEKKKLASKVETLTRKVQGLQAKLNNVPGSAQPPAAALLSSRNPNNENIPPVPSIPTIPTIASLPMSYAPAFKSPATTFSPVPRPKTPDAKKTQLPVLKLKTPETIRTPPTRPLPDHPVVLSGKKRPAPDDFDPSDPLPPQPIVAETSSPRLRRPLQVIRSGFTPVRGSGGRDPRPAISQPSPLRRVTHAAAPTFSDVTNSPRRVFSGQAKPPSRGWLGKIRGGMHDASLKASAKARNPPREDSVLHGR